MAASMVEVCGKETGKKLLKKMRKHQQMLLNREKLTVTDKPTHILCVSNGGLENGVSYEEVEPLFSAHGDSDVLMLPRKSYCIVCYATEEAAESAFTSLNGHTLTAGGQRKSDVILYLSYIQEAPDSLTPSTERPPGLILLEDFVSQELADQILQSVDWNDSPEPGATSGAQKELKHRRVRHYGYEFKYTTNNVDPNEPLSEGIPAVFEPVLERLQASGVIKHYPDQLTVNQYLPGQGIPPHVDTPSAFEDGLVSLSIGSQVIMEFRHPDGRQLSVLLPDRSALVMTGESRYIWSHGITPRKSDIIPTATGGLTLSTRGLRTSFTFRKITGVEYDENKSTEPSLPVSDNSAARLESQHVHQVYEEIADHFSGTRHTPWPRIADFLKQQPSGSVLVDIGCGNGKYFGINKHLFELGSDRSSNLAQICQQRGYQVMVSDILAVPLRSGPGSCNMCLCIAALGSDRSSNLAQICQQRGYQVMVSDILAVPLRSGSCDACLCIAVVHHLSTQERRLKAVSELLRILRQGGKALIYVWAMEQQLNKVKSKYLKGKQQPHETTGAVDKDVKCPVLEDVNSGDSESMIEAGEETLVSETEKLCLVAEQSKVCSSAPDCRKTSSNYKEGETVSKNVNIRQIELNAAEKTSTTESNIGLESDKKCGKSEEVKKEETIEVDKSNAHNADHFSKNTKATFESDSKNNEETGRKQPLAVHVNRTEFKQQDLLVPWQLKNKGNQKEVSTFHRFYHVFQRGELEALCLNAETCKVLESYYDQGNWAVILEKL